MSNLPEQIDALLALNAKGAVSHTIPGLAAELLEKAASALRSKPVAGVEVKPLVDFLWQEFCELPDRSSPEEYPDMALVSQPELTAIVETFAERQELSIPAQEPVAWRREYADPHYQSEVTQWKETADVWVEDGFTVTPLYASPQPEAVITEEIVERAARVVDLTLWMLFADQQQRTGEPMADIAARSGRWAAAKETARAALTAALKEA